MYPLDAIADWRDGPVERARAASAVSAGAA
jgi:hypothetical protein